MIDTRNYRGTGYRPPGSKGGITGCPIPLRPGRETGNSKSGFPARKFIWSFLGGFRLGYIISSLPNCGPGCHRGLTPLCDTEVK